MERWHGVYKNEGRKIEIFLTASLINRLNKGCPLDEIYNKGISCYEVLLDLIENPEVAKKISEIIKLPPEKIKIAAVKIESTFYYLTRRTIHFYPLVYQIMQQIMRQKKDGRDFLCFITLIDFQSENI